MQSTNKQAGGWKGNRGTRQERGYGSEWQRIRKAIITRDMGLCQPCKRKGIVTPFTEVDHITPKAKGGTDDHDNLQCICTPCHKAKTTAEGAEANEALRKQGRRYVDADGWPVEPKVWGFDIPHGLQPSACRVVLVCGPPGSGKTTYVRANAAKHDRIIDLDDIKVTVGGKHWDTDEGVVRRALAYRNMAIRGLSVRTGGTAWLIATAGTPEARAAWMDALGPLAELHVMDTLKAECIDRVKANPERADALPFMLKAIDTWE